MKAVLSVFFLLLLPRYAEAAPDLVSHALYLKWHKQCLALEPEVIDKQIHRFSSQLKANPNDYLAQAYLGSAHALRAKASFWGPTKLKHLRLGQKLLDQAVSSAPKDPRVRMVRAIGYYKVPKIFQTRSTSLADFQFLLPHTELQNGILNNNERQAILFYAYRIYQEENQPNFLTIKRRCHRINPHSYYGKQTR